MNSSYQGFKTKKNLLISGSQGSYETVTCSEVTLKLHNPLLYLEALHNKIFTMAWRP